MRLACRGRGWTVTEGVLAAPAIVYKIENEGVDPDADLREMLGVKQFARQSREDLALRIRSGARKRGEPIATGRERLAARLAAKAAAEPRALD